MFEKLAAQPKYMSRHGRQITCRMVKKVAAWSKIESPMGQKIAVWSKNFSLHGRKKTRHSQKLGRGLVVKQVASWQKKQIAPCSKTKRDMNENRVAAGSKNKSRPA